MTGTILGTRHPWGSSLRKQPGEELKVPRWGGGMQTSPPDTRKLTNSKEFQKEIGRTLLRREETPPEGTWNIR